MLTLDQKLTFIQKAVESVNVAIGISDALGHHIYQNRALSELFGYTTAEELQDAGGVQIVIKDADVAQKLFDNITNGTSWSGELTMVKKSGETFVAYEFADAIKDENGEIIGFISVINDMTERKRIEEELKKSEKRFSDISENAREWFWEVDLEGKYTYTSSVVEQLLGYTKEEILEKHFYDFFHHDEREALKQTAFSTFASKKPFRDFINQNAAKNGEIVWFNTSGIPILNDTGDLIGYRGVDVDVTNLKKVQQDLELSEQKYKYVIDNIEELVLIIDKFGNIIFANAFTLNTLGYSKDELVHKNVTQFLSPTLIPKVLSIIAKEILGIPQLGVEVDIRTKCGDFKTVRFADVSSPIRENGEIVAIMASAVDITEQKKSEAEAKKAHDALLSKMNELEIVNKMTINRELKMIELKQKISDLEEKLGQK